MNGRMWGKATMLLATYIAVAIQTRAALAQEVVYEINWSEIQAAPSAGSLDVREQEGDPDFSYLHIVNNSAEPLTQLLMVIQPANVKKANYALEGQIRYRGVEGEGYLEMWSDFPSGEEYFSRTLGANKEMQPIQGDSDWRYFKLPMTLKDRSDRASRLRLNVVLPGKGEVDIGPVQLKQYASFSEMVTQTGAWWGGVETDWRIGTLGGIVGLLGAVIGTASSMKRFNVARNLCFVMLVVGLVSLVTGAVSLFYMQPYEVYYPLFLIGGLCTILSVVFIPVMRNRQVFFEMQKVHSRDAVHASDVC